MSQQDEATDVFKASSCRLHIALVGLVTFLSDAVERFLIDIEATLCLAQSKRASQSFNDELDATPIRAPELLAIDLGHLLEAGSFAHQR